MRDKVKRIVIVGGGTAGWMAAVAIAKQAAGAGYSIELIESDEIGTVGVGEATIPPITEFNRNMQIDENDFMRATQASFKLAIEFVDWYRRGESYIHPFGFYGVQMHGIYFHHFWLRHRMHGGGGVPEVFNQNIIASRLGRFGKAPPDDPQPIPFMPYAYHFDAGLYARFLRGIAEKLGVKRTEGKIVSVQQHGESGFIESVTLGDGRVVAGDLFVDCSGFRGLLIEQTLKAGYDDWSDVLPCDRALAVPCARIARTTPYTRATAREAGWQWRIPLQHRTGNGYVYCSQFLSEDEAASLLLSRLDGTALADPRPLRFVAGRRRQVWKKNVIAVGLASGFLEPLESTSIHLIQSMIARFLFFFPGHCFDQASIDKFNELARDEMEEIRDFLVLHYTATERDDTPFWRHCRAIPKPDSLRQRWEMYEQAGNIIIEAGTLFRESSWFAVYDGQGLRPKAYHPFADIPSNEELASRFARISRAVQQRVASYPLHDDYLRQNCAAPPVPMKEKMA
ncbi:MAG TPA: tryptophan halogenase family protein [Steroidobacteraceae bacterium]|nr:tryptophan halogenase family protein [Steroidobacteraceae bacterium]